MNLAWIVSYQQRIEEALNQALNQWNDSSPLQEACRYALLNGGKRLRPIFVLLIGEKNNVYRPSGCFGVKEALLFAALSVEYFHTASLIADDLPCMDGDDMRRNKPSLHKVFPENVALLASYTLIAAGYGAIAEAGATLVLQHPDDKEEIQSRVLACFQIVAECAGLQGATSGQYLDLHHRELNETILYEIARKKTGALFEIAFVLGWLLSGRSKEQIASVRKTAISFGMAFQIADDFQDQGQDKQGVNFVQVLGGERALALFEKEVLFCRAQFAQLGLDSLPFLELLDLLHEYIC